MKTVYIRLLIQDLYRQRALRRSGLLILATLVSLVVARLGLPRIGHWLAQSSQVERADAIVVLGGNSDRTLRGIALYQQGLAPEFCHTVNCEAPDGNGEQINAQLAMQHGVPVEAIHCPVTHSTWEDGQAIAVLVKEQNVQSILVVTDWYHSRRALNVIRKQLAGNGIRIYYDSPRASLYSSDNWWQDGEGGTRCSANWLRSAFTGCAIRLPPGRVDRQPRLA